MTHNTPRTRPLPQDRQAVLDDLSLAMLFLDSGTVAFDPEPDPHDPRLVRARVWTHATVSPAVAAAVLCRMLHNLRVPGVRIEREADGIRLFCDYVAADGPWRLELLAPTT